MKLLIENSFTQETAFLVSGKLLIWSTGEYLKLSPMSLPFATQSNEDVSKCFK